MSESTDGPGAVSPEHHRVLVIGGGNAGLSVAGRLRRSGVDDVTVIEPREHHVYQPILSHVAGGTARASDAIRPQASVMPRGVGWIRDAVRVVDPGASQVELESGRRVSYDHLIVSPGIQHDWDRIPGLAAAIRTPAVSSHYVHSLAAKTSRLLRDLTSGTAVFVQPPGPASCAAAAQKPMYLACDYWRSQGVLDDIRVIMVVPDPTVFGIPMIDAELERKIDEYGIELRTGSQLLGVDGVDRIAEIGAIDGSTRERLAFDVLNVEPPQSGPDWIADSGLSAVGETGQGGGFVDIDPRTLRHTAFPNVWSLGDAAATTNSKSGGALREQAKVLAQNLTAVLGGREPSKEYSGYSVAPFTVSRSTLVFAEFDDEYRQKPTVPFWKGLARERRLTWILDRRVLPWVYWNLILKGLA